MNEAKETVIAVKNMSCKAGDRYLLRRIDWEVRQGESWIVFGQNGSGKTTLLSILAGFRGPTEGSVRVFGQAFDNGNALALRRRIGWVSGSFFDNRYSKEAVLDIVLSGVSGTLSTDGRITDSDVIRAKTLLEELQVAHKVYDSFDTLSKGEREKVLLARALVGEPELLLLDEPGTGLDLAARERLLAMIDHMARQRQMTIINVTHHVEEIPQAFQKCLLLKNGRVYGQMSVAEAFNSQVLSDFLGHPVLLHQHHGRLFAQSDEIRGCADGIHFWPR